MKGGHIHEKEHVSPSMKFESKSRLLRSDIFWPYRAKSGISWPYWAKSGISWPYWAKSGWYCQSLHWYLG